MRRPVAFVRTLGVIASLASLAGCGSTVEDVCDDIANECREPIREAACRRDGGNLEEVAEDVGCEQAFEDHLDCLEVELCEWEQRCALTLDELQTCVSGF